jgi:hypothetical protein
MIQKCRIEHAEKRRERKIAGGLLGKKRGPARVAPTKGRGVGRIYGDEVVEMIFAIRRQGEQPGGKRPRPMLVDDRPRDARRFGARPERARSPLFLRWP